MRVVYLLVFFEAAGSAMSLIAHPHAARRHSSGYFSSRIDSIVHSAVRLSYTESRKISLFAGLNFSSGIEFQPR